MKFLWRWAHFMVNRLAYVVASDYAHSSHAFDDVMGIRPPPIWRLNHWVSRRYR